MSSLNKKACALVRGLGSRARQGRWETPPLGQPGWGGEAPGENHRAEETD